MFTFDKVALHFFPLLASQVFPIATKQNDVFVELSQMVQSALDGYHCCVFAYANLYTFTH